MQITRVYKNAASDTIRVDELYMDIIVDNSPAVIYKSNTSMVRFGPRRLKTVPHYSTGASRTVSGIEVDGDFETIEVISGDYTWASKVLGDGTVARIDMSDLPAIGDTV